MIDSSKCKALMNDLQLESIRKAFFSVYDKRIVSLSRKHKFFVFLGDDEDYVLLPYIYCSCPDFRIRVLAKREKRYCYHLLALCLAINNDMIVNYELKDNDIYMVLREIFKKNKTITLRSMRR